MPIHAEDLVDDIMHRWPATIRVFVDHGMGCVGCPVGSFHSVEDACREHGIDQGDFLSALAAKVKAA
jgi:hybrid cluster-associated redox disulfide protein